MLSDTGPHNAKVGATILTITIRFRCERPSLGNGYKLNTNR
uniref:Uncharacterized protein n=1 Tax=Acrobeloides nanus TaxID=290746 RepID=A0A914DIF9_9BILA